MADRLAIYRGALRLLGSGTIASLTEVHPAREALDQAWEPAVEFVLAKGLWNFAIRSVEMGYDGDVEPRFGYDYGFRKPDDWVRTVSINDVAAWDPGYSVFEDEPGYWFENVDTLYARFISDLPEYGWNVGAWRQPFAKTIEAYLAFECGLPISDDRGNRNDLHGLFQTRLKDAKTLDAVDERVQMRPISGTLVRSRGGRGGYRGPWGIIR